MPRHFAVGLAVWVALVSLAPAALAGGPEYPADGTRGLGRGGAIMARADDPRVMERNPALLADLWGSMLYLNSNFGLLDACIQPAGGYGWRVDDTRVEVAQLGPDAPPLYLAAEEGSLGGASVDALLPLTAYGGEPYPEVCDENPIVLAASAVASLRVGDRLGLGLGLIPPELTRPKQYGNRDGTVDTPDGKRPNPIRYMGAHLNIDSFGLLAAAGYRVLPWLRVGAGFRWSVLMVEAHDFSSAAPTPSPRSDILSIFHGQDLFIPGFTVSVHAVPLDSLDVAIGFRWEDSLDFKRSKVDVVSSPWGYGQPFAYQEEPPDGEIAVLPATAPTELENLPVRLTAPPVTVPQLSFGIRFADRLRPRPREYTGLRLATDPVRDPMSDERWDIELDVIYFFNDVYDEYTMYYANDATVDFATVGLDGTRQRIRVPPGDCPDRDEDGQPDLDTQGVCLHEQESPYKLKWTKQITFRLGGDYNLIPGVLALRAGVSYEGRGQDVDFLRPQRGYSLERLGLHAGVTWRLDGRTDISIGYAHFFQETVEIAPNPGVGPLAEDEKRKYHFVDENEADGVARVEAPMTGSEERYYVNAGVHRFSMNALGGSITRHF